MSLSADEHTVVEDERIRNEIFHALGLDSRLAEAKVDVSVSRGTVTLTGTVSSLVARDALLQIARDVRGVKAIGHQLGIMCPGPVIADDLLVSRIRSILSWSGELNAGGIEISVQKGAVLLEGYVDAYWKRTRAGELAGQIAGVTRIDNNLVVVSSRSSTDQSIAEDIMAALQRSMGIDLNRINLKVKDGYVVLTGEVPTYTMYLAVEDTARFTAGVTGVKNMLAVE